MSAKKNSSILNFFKRVPTTSSSSTESPCSKGDVTDSAQKNLSKEEEDDIAEATKLCLEDDDMDEVVEPKVEKKKRKRIATLDSSSDEEYDGDDVPDKTFTPNKKPKLTERNSPFTTPKSSNPKKNVRKEKENSSPPQGQIKSLAKFAHDNHETPSKKEDKTLKDKLSMFASPSVKKEDEDKTAVDSFPHLSYAFLDPAKIMDRNKNKPNDPDYDPGTLYVPDSFMKGLTPAQKQWWEFKSHHYDKILFFKMGKFYELFHMDAVAAVERCGLLYMKKEMAHCGFPEAAFERYAEVLVNLGFKVARIEQTETPADMEDRVKSTPKSTKFDKVVRRELCQITTTGTRLNPNSVRSNEDLCYLTAITATKDVDERVVKVGLCFLDTTVGLVHLSQFDDDKNLSSLETLLALYPPCEIIHDKSKTDVLSNILGKFAAVSKRVLAFPDGSKTLKHIHDYYGDDKNEWPEEFTKHHLDDSDNLGLTPNRSSEMALAAFGAVIKYLADALIDNTVLSQKKLKNVYPSLDLKLTIDQDQQDLPLGANMILDNKTLKHLDIIPETGAGLFSVVDKTLTPMGKRVLKQWVCMPLLKVGAITERQNFVKFFESHPEVVHLLKTDLKGLPDLERVISSIHASGIKLPPDHPEQRAIYYEQATYASKKVAKLLSALESLEKLQSLFKKKLLSKTPNGSIFADMVLDKFPDLSALLDFFKDAFNHAEAEKSGKIMPKKGVDEDYDAAKADRSKLEEDLDQYLDEQKKYFGSRDVKYFGSGNNMYQLEVPESLADKKAKSDYTLSSKRKGFKRFTTEETRDFLARQIKVDEAESLALSEVNRKIFLKFSEYKALLYQVINLTSFTDAILSLYFYSMSLGEESCFPELVPSKKGHSHLKFVQGRHPIVISATPDVAFIPNDFELDEHLAILTGANMGGKSTLMRQTALLTILAQIGSKVPANQFELSPVDRIFTRIGASDNIFEKESTFFVELSETKIILNYATNHSLVLIDELGRGTTTFDGCAIAYAVAKFLTAKKCRTIFSTHYHELTKEFVTRHDMKLYHMSVMEDDEDIVFMYTVASGPCSKSHGFNAAKLAGIPQDVIANGLKVAEQFEMEQTNLLELAEIIS